MRREDLHAKTYLFPLNRIVKPSLCLLKAASTLSTPLNTVETFTGPVSTPSVVGLRMYNLSPLNRYVLLSFPTKIALTLEKHPLGDGGRVNSLMLGVDTDFCPTKERMRDVVSG